MRNNRIYIGLLSCHKSGICEGVNSNAKPIKRKCIRELNFNPESEREKSRIVTGFRGFKIDNYLDARDLILRDVCDESILYITSDKKKICNYLSKNNTCIRYFYYLFIIFYSLSFSFLHTYNVCIIFKQVFSE